MIGGRQQFGAKMNGRCGVPFHIDPQGFHIVPRTGHLTVCEAKQWKKKRKLLFFRSLNFHISINVTNNSILFSRLGGNPTVYWPKQAKRQNRIKKKSTLLSWFICELCNQKKRKETTQEIKKKYDFSSISAENYGIWTIPFEISNPIYLHQPIVVTMQTTWIRFVDFDHRNKIFVCHQHFIFVVENASQINATGKNRGKKFRLNFTCHGRREGISDER